MLKFLIHLFGGYTPSEYNQLLLEINSLNEKLSTESNKVISLTKDNTTLKEQVVSLTKDKSDLQTQVDNLNKIKDSFVIKVDGGKVWIENE